MNEVFLMGRLTRDPEIRHLNGENRVCSFGLAVNEAFRRSNGQWANDVCFVDCEAWDTGADAIAEKFQKGDSIIVFGRLRLDEWVQDGQKRTKLKVRVRRFQRPLGAKNESKVDAEPEQENVSDNTEDENIPF